MLATQSDVRLVILDPDTPGGFKLSMACRPASRSATADAMTVWRLRGPENDGEHFGLNDEHHALTRSIICRCERSPLRRQDQDGRRRQECYPYTSQVRWAYTVRRASSCVYEKSAIRVRNTPGTFVLYVLSGDARVFGVLSRGRFSSTVAAVYHQITRMVFAPREAGLRSVKRLCYER